MSAELSTYLNFVYESYAVRRFHTQRLLNHTTVGEHSAGVAILAAALLPTIRVEALLAALLHDVGEHVTGDIPAPVKRHLDVRDKFKKYEARLHDLHYVPREILTVEEERAIALADILDGLRHTLLELTMGNETVGIREARSRYLAYLNEFEPLSPRELDVYNAVSKQRTFGDTRE